MYIFNDMDLLKQLCRVKLLDFILGKCCIAISAIRLSDYSFLTKKEIEQYPAIEVAHVDNGFMDWAKDKRRILKAPPKTVAIKIKN
jgi:hypothetical protein